MKDKIKNFDPENDLSRLGAGPAVGADAAGSKQSTEATNTGLDHSRKFSIGPIGLTAVGDGIRLEHSSVGTKVVDETKHNGETASGFGYNGELKIGAITLALSATGALRFRHENVGTETEVETPLVAKVLTDAFFDDVKKGEPGDVTIAEAGVEGVLEDAFFTRKIAKDGSDKTGDATKG